MPEYTAKIRKIEKAEIKEVKVFAPCATEAEREAEKYILLNKGGEIISVCRVSDSY